MVKMPTQTASGMYKLVVLDSEKKVKYESPWRHNLILNSGMSLVATHYWIDCLSYCYAGQGNDVNAYDSGADVASSDAVGAVVSTGVALPLNGGSFVAGDCILWDTGEQGRIISISGAGACQITTEYASPGGIPSGPFTVLKTSRTKLTDTNVPTCGRCSSYLASPPNALVTYIHNANDSIVTSRITYDFPVVPAGPSITYYEIGISPHNAIGSGPWAPANMPVLFSRIYINGGLTLDAGDYLRVVYQLSITISPTSEQASSMAFDNDGTPETWTGLSKLYTLGLSIVNINATSVTNQVTNFDTYANEPALISGSSYVLWVSFYGGSHTGTFPNYGQTTVRNDSYSQGPTLVPTGTFNLYESGLTYSQEKRGTWAIGQVNSSPIASFGYGIATVINLTTIYPSVYCGLMNIFDAGHTKLNTQTLTLSLKYSWSRTLTVD